MGHTTTLRLVLAGLIATAGSGAGVAIGAAADQTASAEQAVVTEGASNAIPTTPDRIGRILAHVMVNGHGPYRFMLDTGASRTVVATATLPLLGLALNTDERVSVLGISGSAIVGTVRLATLDAGALHFEDIQVPVLAGPVLADIDGILGIDALRGKTMTADFARDRFSITGALGGIPIGDAVVPGHLLPQGLLVVDCRIGVTHASAIIDTGSTRTLGNWALFNALQREWRGALSFPTGVVDATEALQAAQFQQVPIIRFGQATVENLYVTFGNFHVFKTWGLDDRPALLIGMDVLGSFAEVTIDYRRMELGVLPRPGMISLRH